MRIIIFFDLPVETAKDRREYSRFRRFLVKEGFIIMQESVYCKLALNMTVVESVSNRVRKNKPSEGIVQMLTVTERQYNSMEFIVGAKQSDIIDSDERLIVI